MIYALWPSVTTKNSDWNQRNLDQVNCPGGERHRGLWRTGNPCGKGQGRLADEFRGSKGTSKYPASPEEWRSWLSAPHLISEAPHRLWAQKLPIEIPSTILQGKVINTFQQWTTTKQIKRHQDTTPYILSIYISVDVCIYICIYMYTHARVPTLLNFKNIYIGLPWWRSGWESACQCRGHRFEPWSGKIPHAVEQLSPCATTTEPARLEPVLRNKRGRDSERPAHRDEEWVAPACHN